MFWRLPRVRSPPTSLYLTLPHSPFPPTSPLGSKVRLNSKPALEAPSGDGEASISSLDEFLGWRDDGECPLAATPTTPKSGVVGEDEELRRQVERLEWEKLDVEPQLQA